MAIIRVAVASVSLSHGMQRLVVQPCPSHLVQCLTLGDDTVVTLRPIRPDDGGFEQELERYLADESRCNRFRETMRELSPRIECVMRVDTMLEPM